MSPVPIESPSFALDLRPALARLESQTTDRSIELFRHATLTLKLYAPRGHDPQTPHARDEVYFVAQGRGVFFDGAARHPIEPGTCLFVAAGRSHRFEQFSDDFAVWVVFYGPEGGEVPASG